MRKQLLYAALIAAPGLLLASSPSPVRASKETPFRYAYKSPHVLQMEKELRRVETDRLLDPASSGLRTKQADISGRLDPSSDFGYLEGPDNSVWYYTSDHVIEKVPVEGGYEGLTESVIREYKFTIYDSDLKPVGTIHDRVTIDESALETKPVQVLLNSVVSKKFFNTDDKYELIVSVAMNRDLSKNPYPSVNYHSFVYSLGGAKTEEGFDAKVQSVEGYLVESVNSATDKWSENFFLTFLTESADVTLEDYDEFLDSCKVNVTTYSKASYGGTMKVFQEKSLKLNCLPGDQMNSPFMLAFVHDGKACFAFAEYEINFYQTQGEIDFETGWFSDPVQNEGNNLILTVYADNGSTPELKQTTKIPVQIDKSIEGALFTFYGIGNLRYENDVDYGSFLPSQDRACFIVNKQVYVAKSDDYVDYYYVCDPEGESLLTLAEKCDSFIEMSDIKGEDPQIGFVFFSGEEYRIDFTDLYSGTVTSSLGQTINGKSISSSIDRVPYGDSYRYAVSMLNADVDDEDNVIHTVSWIDSNAKYVGEDKLNFGKDVTYAVLYMDQATLDPYLFDTDSNREYMALVKRYRNGSQTEMEEELLITSTSGNTVLRLTPDSDKGSLFNIAPLTFDVKPRLNVVYRTDDYRYTSEFYDLPLVKFSAGGDGSEENPYLISTIGDFQQIAGGLSSHYKIVADIDGTNMEFQTVNGQFEGTIDGGGHTLSNLTLTPYGLSCGLWSRISNNAYVKDLTVVNAEVELNDYIDRAGVFAGESSEAHFDNVHVYNLKVSHGDDFTGCFGGLVGNAMLRSTFKDCSVANADLSIPNGSVGGLVGSLRTGVSIDACSFTGVITGGSEVGGITGSSLTGDEKISDCHVDADIVAQNIVGGIIGSSKRSNVTRCYVEGSIEATTPNRWTDEGPCAGGIAGLLSPSASVSEGSMALAPAAEGVVTNNMVRLSSLKGYTSTTSPSYEQQRTTMHRIVGWTRVNIEPDASLVTTPDDGIVNNYAIDSLAKVSSDISDADTTTEGKSVAEDQLGRDFFENTLGMQFGEGQPWNELAEYDPALNHEAAAFFNPAEISAEENSTFEATLVIVSRTKLDPEEVISGFSCDSSDEGVASPTGEFHFDGNNLIIEFRCSKIGTAVVTAYVNGGMAKCTVNSKESGVEEVLPGIDEVAVTYDGHNVIAPGCSISLYNISGSLVASSRDLLSVEGMQKGVCVAVATDACGRRKIVKILVK